MRGAVGAREARMKKFAIVGMFVGMALALLGHYASASDAFLLLPVKAVPVQAAYDWTGF